MANRGPAQRVVGAAADVPGRRDPVLVLNVARLFMLYGALAVVATIGSPPVVDAGQAILGLGLWLLGVCLLAFVPILIAGRRFPRFALIVAAVSDVVLRYCFAPWN
jgi:hypothetical protein